MKKTMLIFSLILCLLLTGCDYEAIIDEVVHEVANQLTEPEDVVEPFIGFAETEPETTDQLRQLTPQELLNYTPRYGIYNTYTYFRHLSESEKLIYRAYEYALDEGLPYCWIDDRLLQETERSLFQILEFFSLDSAVVEQNITYDQNGHTVTHTILDVQTAEENYTAIFLEDFTKKRLKNKDNAILQAKIMLSRLQSIDLYPDREVAEHIYKQLGGCTGYKDDVENEEYLYAGLCEGWTNCDGFANAFALMCILQDIPCIEVNSDTPPDETGHTWNLVCLDGKWVHVDGTGSTDDIWSECDNRSEKGWIYFGFPDVLAQERVLHSDLLPNCPEGLHRIVHITSGQMQNFNLTVKRAFEENDNKWAIILVDQGNLEEQITEELATELGFGLHYIHYETAEGKTVYYLYNNEQ
jgi:hypothetical protein